MNDKDEEILHRALAGELAEDSAELRGLFTREPGLREAFAELSSLASELDRQSSAEAGAITRARAETTPEDRATLAGSFAPVRAHGTTIDADRRFAPRRLPRFLAAAAIVLTAAAGLYLATRPEEPPAKPPMLGRDGRPVVIAPIGERASFEVFRWQADPQKDPQRAALPSGARYVVQVHARTADGARGALLSEATCTDTHWNPNAEQLERMGSSIAWRAVLRLPNGMELASDFVSASR